MGKARVCTYGRTNGEWTDADRHRRADRQTDRNTKGTEKDRYRQTEGNTEDEKMSDADKHRQTEWQTKGSMNKSLRLNRKWDINN